MISLILFGGIVYLLFLLQLSIQPKVEPPLFLEINFDVVENPPVNLPKPEKIIPPKPIQNVIEKTKSSASAAGGEKKEVSTVKSEKVTESAAPKEKTPNSKVVSNKVLTNNQSQTKTVVNTAEKTENPKESNNKSLVNQSGERKSDNRGREALGNLLRGRQGNASGSGNQGEGTIGNQSTGRSPNPGAGGNEQIGSGGRKLVAWIPGTEGKGGERPAHNCGDVPGKFIKIAYTVNAEGRVISTSYHSGISDECIINTARKWVRDFVRAESGSGNASGIYTIYF